VTIEFRRLETLDLCLVRFSGAVRFAELRDQLHYRAERRQLLTADTLHVISPDAAFVDLNPARLEAFRETHRSVLKPSNLPALRRSAWLCFSDACLEFLHLWLGGSAPDDGLYSAPALVNSMAEAAEWLMAPVEELTAFEAGLTGRLIATFPALQQARHA